MTFLGDIGGLYDFFVILIQPCVTILVGDRLTYFLLGKLFITNSANSKYHDGDSGGGLSDNDSNNSDP